MKSFNTYYVDKTTLKLFINHSKIKDNSSLLIQLFPAFADREYIQQLLGEICSLLPSAIIIGATTDGEIMNGLVTQNQTVVSFTQFKHTTLDCYGIEHSDDGFLSGQAMVVKLVKKETKAVISFSSGLNTSGEKYLDGIDSLNRDVIVAGGLAGDNAKFVKTYVFTKDTIFDSGAVAVALNSEILQVYNEYAYSWDRVGMELLITSAKDNRVYTIDNRKAYDVYSHYLGENIAKRLPESGTEFPLVINRDGFSVSRAVMSVEEDGSLIFAGNLKVGDVVQFGYGNVDSIFERSEEIVTDVGNRPAEAIFIYSCMARRHYLGKDIEVETFSFNDIAPTAGFFTYGEFFSSKNRELLNQTMTLLILSENSSRVDIKKRVIHKKNSDNFTTMHNSVNALANLVKVTSKELNTKTQRLFHQAHHDSLTGLPNRTLFNDRLSHALSLGKRHNQEHAVFFIDLDNFKNINDSLGHDIGDSVLKIVAARLDESVRIEDTLARLGGDEFALIVEDINSVDDVSFYAQRILDTLSQECIVAGHTFHLSCSIGISLFPQDGTNTQNLLKYSDVAMYKAKESGRNNFQFYSSEMTALVLDGMELEADLRVAIANNEFEVYYQPKMDVPNNIVRGLEALVRWNHPKKGRISPNKFIPYAEKSDLIVSIDTIVMNSAMEQVKAWYKEGLNPGILSVNLAIKQLESDNFLQLVKDTLSNHDFKAEWLNFEVLEREIMNNPEQSVKKLKDISALGVSISIDDFGTGQSSFTYLKRFPLNELKIDKSFVDDVPFDEEDNAIVKTVIALADALSLNIIAEGVESKEQVEFLLDNGCSNMQGYYFCKPLSTAYIREFLLKHKLS